MSYTLTTDEDRERLFLKMSSPEADAYYNLDCNSIGKEISYVLPEEICNAIYFNFHKVKNTEYAATFAYEKQAAFWRVDFEYSYPEIHIITERIITKEHVQSVYKNNFMNVIPFTLFQDTYGLTFTATKHADGIYYIDSASQHFVSAFDTDVVGKRLDGKLLVRTHLPSAFEFCIENDFPMILTDYYISSTKKIYFLVLYILPVLHENTSIFVSANIVDEDTFSHLNYNNSPYNSELITAQAFFDDNLNFVLTQSSEAFAKVFPKQKLDILFNNEKLMLAARTRTTQSCFVEVPELGSYFFYFMPNLYESKIHILGTQKEKFENVYSGITENLTSREAEIFEHLLSGEPFKAISIELGIAEGTVKKLSSNIYKKLNVSSRIELLRSVFEM